MRRRRRRRSGSGGPFLGLFLSFLGSNFIIFSHFIVSGRAQIVFVSPCYNATLPPLLISTISTLLIAKSFFFFLIIKLIEINMN